jgi:hypothetical protein
MTEPSALQSKRVRSQNSLEAINRLYYARGWTDGLPIIPPTEERVWDMLAGTRRRPDEVIGKVPPKWGECTVEKVAINAVMAGCLPEYMPVILTALEAMLDPAFNLYGIQATTHPVAPLVIVNGPIRAPLDLNGAYNAFGQGWRANATIGRALRLILMNAGGGLPGKLDRATAGHPGKYTYCVAENEEESPWEPLHVSRGLRPEQSAVTVIGAEAPHNINDHGSASAAGILTTVAHSMTTVGSNNAYFRADVLVAFGPEHAHTVAREGLSRADVQRWLWEQARIPLDRFARDNVERFLLGRWPPDVRAEAERWLATGQTSFRVPLTDKPEDMLVAVIGGAGKHSQFIPTFGGTRAVTRAIAEGASA